MPGVAGCPLSLTSPNAPSKRDILGTVMLSVLAGHRRYAHITTLRCDPVNPPLLGMAKVVSEDAVRRALSKIETEAGRAWLQGPLRLLHSAAVARTPCRASCGCARSAPHASRACRGRSCAGSAQSHPTAPSRDHLRLDGGIAGRQKENPRRALQPIIFGLLQFSLLNLRPSSY